MKRLALLSLIVANLVHQPTPVVRTRSGLVRGRLSENGKFYQYFGVPYGFVNEENRFQAPLPHPSWEGVLEAINENTRCPQKFFPATVLGDPNCLKLNIYVPLTSTSPKDLPVMVYLHGGSFLEGTGSGFLYGGDHFAEHGVILVGVSYRLQTEGFLCLGIREAPGNAGLKDQIAALRWIKENIAAFGGDPDNVTLFGESAGAVSTSYLILSPAARGLFHKSIQQSGSTLAPWALQHDPIATASALAKEYGYQTKDPHELYRILSNKTIDDLILTAHHLIRLNHSTITADTLFVPCIEKNIPGIEPVITEHPLKILTSGNYSKIPMIVGSNDLEGLYFVARDYGTSLLETPYIHLQPDLVFPNETDRYKTIEKVRKFYFDTKKDDMIMDATELYSDLQFKFPSVVESSLYSRTNDKPIYYYLFKYSGYVNMPKIISRFLLVRGASHADELFYMFKPRSFPLWQFIERSMIDRMVTMWTNFAKYSNPTPSVTSLLPVHWEPSRASNPIALVIDTDLSTGPLWNDTSVAFWNETYTKYRRKQYGFSSETTSQKDFSEKDQIGYVSS